MVAISNNDDDDDDEEEEEEDGEGGGVVVRTKVHQSESERARGEHHHVPFSEHILRVILGKKTMMKVMMAEIMIA